MPKYDVPNAAPEPLRRVQEFLNTADLEGGHEWLGSPAALEQWLRERGFRLDRAVRPADLRRAVAVREALRGLARANTGSTLDDDAAALLADASRVARLVIAVDRPAGVSLQAAADGIDGALGSLLAIVARAAFDGSWARLKSCSHCRWAYYDYSRNRSARWCSMSLCGNRTKVRAYRSRRSGGGNAAP